MARDRVIPLLVASGTAAALAGASAGTGILATVFVAQLGAGLAIVHRDALVRLAGGEESLAPWELWLPICAVALAQLVALAGVAAWGDEVSFFFGRAPEPRRNLLTAGFALTAFLLASLVPVALRLRSRAAAMDEPTLRQWIPGIALAVALPLGVWTTLTAPWSGDEPHYLLMADNLRAGDGVDLRAAYAEARWTRFFPGMPSGATRAAREWFGAHAFLGPQGQWFSVHGWGAPALLLPLLLLGTIWAVPVSGSLALAAFAWFAYRIARNAGASPGSSVLAALAVAVSAPLAVSFSRPAVEMPAALATALALTVATSSRPTPARALVAAAALALLPWIHFRLAPAAAVIAAAAFFGHGPRRVRLLPAVGAAAGGLSLSLFCRTTYGFWMPNQVLGDPMPTGFWVFAWTPLDVHAWAGSLADPSTGLWVVWPAGLAALAGLGRATIPHALLAAVTILPVALTNVWLADVWGRMLAAAIGPAAALLAVALDRLSTAGRPVRSLAALALCLSLFSTLWLIAVPGSRESLHPLAALVARWTAPSVSTIALTAVLVLGAFVFLRAGFSRAARP